MELLSNTQKYYNSNAEEHYKSRKDIIVEKQLNFFLTEIKQNELILDLGCGSGNNLFEMKRRGYNAIGADFSLKLIEIIKKEHNEKIFYLDFRDTDAVNSFITKHNVIHLFCSASLLHLSKTEFKNFINNLKLPGLFFFSLKEGFGEEIDTQKRLFSYYQINEIEEIVNPAYEIINFQALDDVLRRDKRWLNWILRKSINNKYCKEGFYMNKNKEDNEILKELCLEYNVSYEKVVKLLEVVKDYEMVNRRNGIYDALKLVLLENRVDI